MKWYIGIDGGGTKTSFVVGSDDGQIADQVVRSGCSYQQIGIENVVALLKEGVLEVLDSVGAAWENCAGCCVGVPCFGENKEADIEIERMLGNALYPIPVKIVNDIIVGWAGGTRGQEGIHLVAGTGSIAVGCGCDSCFARSGGWTEFFGDEGSCYWVGKEAMSLFSKEADGRVQQGPLYQIVKENYSLKNDFDFIDIVIKQIAPYREKVAAFQRLALNAAKQGDTEAQLLYKRAAKELAQIVFGVKSQLVLSKKNIMVSYHGGLFHAGDLVLKPLAEELELFGCELQPPCCSANEGALLLAVKEFSRKEKTQCI